MPALPITDSEKKSLRECVERYAANPCTATREALQGEIVALGYRHRKVRGSHTGGKSGSLAFDINPDPSKNSESSRQHELFTDLIDFVNTSLKNARNTPSKSSANFVWRGTTTYQIKKDPSKIVSKGFFDVRAIQREELNDNTAELVVDCISETLEDDDSPIVPAVHPSSTVFADHDGQTIIASQYLPDTINTLSGFVRDCIQSLDIDDRLIKEHQLDIDIDKLRDRYKNFQLDAEDEIAIVEKIPDRGRLIEGITGIKLENMIERDDLNQLATLFVLKHENDHDFHGLSLNQPIFQGLLEELSFSHLVADHDVNPGNFVIRRRNHELEVSRIDFGMANYHFTRGRIFGFSRRPFANLFFDIPKESFRDFICREKIGFGMHTFLNPFLVASKTFKHLLGIKALFDKPPIHDRALVQDICHRNMEMHDYLSTPSAHRRIIERFMNKINYLPSSNKLDILRDLKLMEMQSVRTAYLDFQPGFRVSSTLKLLGMITTTPLFMATRLIISPFSYAFRFRNPVPLTTWTFIQEQSLNETLRVGRSDPLLADREIAGCMERLLSNIAVDNKPQLSPDALSSVTKEVIEANRFEGLQLPKKLTRRPPKNTTHTRKANTRRSQ